MVAPNRFLLMSRLDEMVDGYMAGYGSGAPDLPECHKDRSPQFRHGWLNGRDDRIGKPREKADTLKRRAGMILGEDA